MEKSRCISVGLEVMKTWRRLLLIAQPSDLYCSEHPGNQWFGSNTLSCPIAGPFCQPTIMLAGPVEPLSGSLVTLFITMFLRLLLHWYS